MSDSASGRLKVLRRLLAPFRPPRLDESLSESARREAFEAAFAAWYEPRKEALQQLADELPALLDSLEDAEDPQIVRESLECLALLFAHHPDITDPETSPIPDSEIHLARFARVFAWRMIGHPGSLDVVFGYRNPRHRPKASSGDRESVDIPLAARVALMERTAPSRTAAIRQVVRWSGYSEGRIRQALKWCDPEFFRDTPQAELKSFSGALRKKVPRS